MSKREQGEPRSMVVSDGAVKHTQTPGKVPERGFHGNQPEQGAGTCMSKMNLWYRVFCSSLISNFFALL